MPFTEATLTTLITAGTLATTARVLSYLIGTHDGSYLRFAIAEMGTTVVVIEIAIVLLRFFTTLRLMKFMPSYLVTRNEGMVFVALGVSITFLFCTISLFLKRKKSTFRTGQSCISVKDLLNYFQC